MFPIHRRSQILCGQQIFSVHFRLKQERRLKDISLGWKWCPSYFTEMRVMLEGHISPRWKWCPKDIHRNEGYLFSAQTFQTFKGTCRRVFPQFLDPFAAKNEKRTTPFLLAILVERLAQRCMSLLILVGNTACQDFHPANSCRGVQLLFHLEHNLRFGYFPTFLNFTSNLIKTASSVEET